MNGSSSLLISTIFTSGVDITPWSPAVGGEATALYFELGRSRFPLKGSFKGDIDIDIDVDIDALWGLSNLVSQLQNGPVGTCCVFIWRGFQGILTGLTRSTEHPSRMMDLLERQEWRLGTCLILTCASRSRYPEASKYL